MNIPLVQKFLFETMQKMRIFTTLFLIGISSCFQTDYYWREYFGTTPVDAVVGGTSLDGRNVFIGQAYLKNAGLIVVQITAGERYVDVPYNGVHRVDNYIKILCGPKDKFYWMRANATDLHLQVTNKHAVLGGHEDINGWLNIGRFSLSGDIKIGKVGSFYVGSANFYYNDEGKEGKLRSYEILMYKNTDHDLRFWEDE